MKSIIEIIPQRLSFDPEKNNSENRSYSLQRKCKTDMHRYVHTGCTLNNYCALNTLSPSAELWRLICLGRCRNW